MPVPCVDEHRDGAVPAGGSPHRRLVRPDASDPDGRTGTLNRGWQQSDVVSLKVLPVMVHRLARPEAVQEPETLVQALGEHLRIGRLAEAAVLVLDRPAESRTEDHAPTADGVPRRPLAGKLLPPTPGRGG